MDVTEYFFGVGLKNLGVRSTAFVLAILLLNFSPAQAQNIPPGETPGSEHERFRQEAEYKKQEKKIREKKKPVPIFVAMNI